MKTKTLNAYGQAEKLLEKVGFDRNATISNGKSEFDLAIFMGNFARAYHKSKKRK